jgi:hypothetical protein
MNMTPRIEDLSATNKGGFIRHKQRRIYPPQTKADLSATNKGGFIRHKQWRINPPLEDPRPSKIPAQVGGGRAGLQYGVKYVSF